MEETGSKWLFSVTAGIFWVMIWMPACSGRTPHPLSAKASLLRFWRRELPGVPLPTFLLKKASPLNATSMAVFSALLEHNSLDHRISSFCAAADLLCPLRGASADLASSDGNFTNYLSKQFKTYQTTTVSFNNYSRNENVATDTFHSYGAHGNASQQQFSNYVNDVNVGDESFKKYGVGDNAGTRAFITYGPDGNEPSETFKTYAQNSNADNQSFTSYSDSANVFNNDFAAYSEDAKAVVTGFTSYANASNVFNNSFSRYDVGGTGARERFSFYADDANSAHNEFRTYAGDANGASESFAKYADDAAIGFDSFSTYAKAAKGSTPVAFSNYGNTFFRGNDSFTNYAQKAQEPNISFKAYALPTTVFKQYFNKKATSFSIYATNATATSPGVQPGKFFRESKLKTGTHMPLPDLKDYMPQRSFLPRSLADKFPVTSAALPGLLKLFRIPSNSSMETMMRGTVYDCERAPAQGETKRCVTSVEAMVEFAKQILGGHVQVMTTASTRGSRRNVTVGTVSGLAGGGVTQSVSCHQSMFPFLMYYCHSVPKVRVYEADLMGSDEKKDNDKDDKKVKVQKKINHGVGICHLDTTVWSPNHAAFRALGGKPGGIEVCHWIFQDDLIWVPTSSS